MADAKTYDYVNKVGLEYTLTKLYQFLNSTFGFRSSSATVMPGAPESSKIHYDNTTSTFTAVNVQAVIDEIKGILDDLDDAENINYSNTTSKLTASKVQAAIDEIVSKFAALSGAEFTGAVKVPAPPTLTDDEKKTATNAANVAYVTTAISTALAGVTGISFQGPYADYDTMVATVTDPKTGIIYLVSNNGKGQNVNDEYFWDGSKYELFGTTAVDLSDYVKSSDLTAITTAQIKTAFTSAGFPTPTD